MASSERSVGLSRGGDPTTSPPVAVVGGSVEGRPSALGLVLMDSSRRPFYANAEAVQILTYSEAAPKPASVETFFPRRLRSLLDDTKASERADFVSEFISGRRRYSCRVFQLLASFSPRGGTVVAQPWPFSWNEPLEPPSPFPSWRRGFTLPNGKGKPSNF